MKKLFFILFVTLNFCCKKEKVQPCLDFTLNDPTLFNDEEYTIYNTVINDAFKNAEFIHVDQQTDTSTAYIRTWSESELSAAGIQPELLADYIDKNDSVYYLNDNLPSQAHLFNFQEFLCLDTWSTYYNKYQNSSGYLRFTRPGFNPLKNRAMIERSWYCGDTCEERFILVLYEQYSRWVVVFNIPL